jgi:predicted phosphoadenosine phosphosulfate sulfurtransferase
MSTNITLKKKVHKYLTQWESMGYRNCIPDEADKVLESFNLVPSYRLICMAIMKNDIHLTSLGMSKPKCNLYNEIKRSELIQKGKIKKEDYQQGKLL